MRVSYHAIPLDRLLSATASSIGAYALSNSALNRPEMGLRKAERLWPGDHDRFRPMAEGILAPCPS